MELKGKLWNEGERKDVAVFAKELRGVIKEMQGVMACTIKRWKATKHDAAHDVIYIQGGVSFDVHHSERLERCGQILDRIEELAVAEGYRIICKESYGRIWLIRY
jgi:hypothetical protein